MATDAANSQQQENQTEQRADALRTRIREADRAYYEQDNPIISDAQYDDLMRELRAIEEAIPHSSPPTRRPSMSVASPPGLQKYATARRCSAWRTCARTRSYKPGSSARRQFAKRHFRYVCEPKIDGLSMNLIYEKGKLILL